MSQNTLKYLFILGFIFIYAIRATFVRVLYHVKPYIIGSQLLLA